MLDRVIFFTLLPYFYDILDIIKYDCSRKSAKEILFTNKENRKAAKERRAKEREHEAKVAHYKKIWSWAGPALIVVVIVGLIIASVLDSKRLSVKSASEDTSTASSASTSASASLQTDTSLTIEDGDTVNIDYPALKRLVGKSVQVKEEIVEQDPFERNIRKALNLGHTVGHAFESMALAENRPVLHGYAVAWGIVCELYLSHTKVGFPKEKMRQTIRFIKDNYGVFTFDCKKYEQLYAFMTHDKKNTSGTINFTLLKDIGDICINQTADKDTIFDMLDFYRECMGI